jgi:hypothetical protein
VGDHPVPALAHLIALDDHVVARLARPSATAAYVVWHANQLVSARSSRWLQLHAAGVVLGTADGGPGAVVLPAEMNSGKSTLATGLVARGAGYLTDETVAVDPATGQVAPYPKAIALDPGSFPLFADLEPAHVAAHPALAHDKWYLDPTTVGPAPVPTHPVLLGTVVFPTYVAGRPTTLDRLDPVDAAAQLARNAFNLVELGQPGVDQIAHLAATVPCWRLVSSDLAEACAAVERAAGAPARSPGSS